MDGTGWGDSCSESLNSTPNPVVTAFSLAGFAVLAFAFPFVERFSGLGLGLGLGLTVLAGLAASDPVVTPFSLAGFAGGRRPHAPGGRTPIPAAFRYAPAVSRRTPVSCSMRRKGHPSRPRTMTCCFFASLKTLLIPTKATALRRNQRPRASFPLAGFEVTLIGRFWVTPEGWRREQMIAPVFANMSASSMKSARPSQSIEIQRRTIFQKWGE